VDFGDRFAYSTAPPVSNGAKETQSDGKETQESKETAEDQAAQGLAEVSHVGAGAARLRSRLSPSMSRLSPYPRPITSPLARFRLHIRHSPIHRLGVFADARIPARKYVIEYGGRLIRARNVYRELRKPGRPKRILMARLNRNWTIDAISGGSGAEYVNHSCHPNLYMRKTARHIYLISRRRIRRGEELTLDYKLRPRWPRLKCRCGEAKCRGFMNLP